MPSAFALPAILLVVAAALAAGGVSILLGFAFLAALAMVLDCRQLESWPAPPDRPRWMLEAPLVLSPILIVLLTVIALLRASGAWQPPGFAAYDLFDTILATLTLGAIYGTVAGVVGHEFIHRLDSPGWRTAGLLVQAFPLDTADAVEHVFGHHVTVATADDPSTARRGQGFWDYFGRNILAATQNAWRLERGRLEQAGRSGWSPHNVVLQGFAVQFALFVACWLIGGWTGLVVFVLAASMGRVLVEVSKYVSHYGLVRVPGKPIEPRHSWNAAGAVVADVMLNSSCHSDHHIHPERAYWNLSRQPGMPTQTCPAGVLLFAVLVPPIWIRMMAPRLAAWDAHVASDAELALIAGQSKRRHRPEPMAERAEV
jgi:alkane 1-monooxygenase